MKVWLDRNAANVVNVHKDQRFYAVEYTGPHPELVSQMADTVKAFQDWAFEYYHAGRQGAALPEFPFAPLEEAPKTDGEKAPKQSKTRSTSSRAAKRVRASDSAGLDSEGS